MTSFALFAAIFVFSMSAKIFPIFRFSVFGVYISYFFFHFYIKQKNLNIFFKIFSKHKISHFSEFQNFENFMFFRNFRILRILCFFRKFRILRILCFFRNFRILRILCFFRNFRIFENFRFFFFPLLPEGKMKI